MDKLNNIFDAYSLNARVKPALFLLFPLIVSILTWYPEGREKYTAIFGVLITFGIIAFLANRVASIGREKEKALFSEWGGQPTTILLQYRGDIIDPYTKTRYHQWLNKNVAGLLMPTEEDEKSNPEDAYQKYESAIRFLRNKTRDKVKYPLVFKENINYGFSRNLWAVKPIGIALSLAALSGNSGLLWFKQLQVEERELIDIIKVLPIEGLLAWFVSLSFVIIWVFWVRKDWVKTRAFAYARALLEVCEG